MIAGFRSIIPEASPDGSRPDLPFGLGTWDLQVKAPTIPDPPFGIPPREGEVRRQNDGAEQEGQRAVQRKEELFEELLVHSGSGDGGWVDSGTRSH
jgi:hypothetical protein